MIRTVMKRPLEPELKQTIEKRNKRLDAFFTLFGIEVDIIGDMETPAVIYQDKCLSCFVHNFNLVFTDHFDKGNELYRIKLQKDQEIDTGIVQQWLDTANHRQIFRLKIKDIALYLVGYNFKGATEAEGKYPVFGKFGPKIYFTEDYAQNLIDMYGLDYCEIV